MLGKRVTHENAGVLDVHAAGKFGKAVAAHQQEVIGGNGVQVFVSKGSSILEPRRYQPLPFRLAGVEFHAAAAQAHDGPSEYPFDLSAAESHRHKSVFKRQNFQQGAARDRTLSNSGLDIGGVDQRDRGPRLRAHGICNQISDVRLLRG